VLDDVLDSSSSILRHLFEFRVVLERLDLRDVDFEDVALTDAMGRRASHVFLDAVFGDANVSCMLREQWQRQLPAALANEPPDSGVYFFVFNDVLLFSIRGRCLVVAPDE